MINEYYGLYNWQFYFSFFYFLVAVFIAFYLPGFYFIVKLKLKNYLTTALLSCVLGLVLFVAQGLILGYLNFRVGTYFYLSLFFLNFLFNFSQQKNFFFQLISQIKFKVEIFLIFILGFLVQMPAILSSGLRNQNGVSFRFSNGFDGVMHLTFIRSLVERVPALRLEAYSEPLLNYHYLSDLVMAEISRIFRLPIIHLFFHYFPIFLFFVTSLLFVQLIKQINSSRFFTFIGLLFFYLSGEMAFVFSFMLHGIFGVDIATIDNGADQFLNMPFIFAKLIFIAIMYLLNIFVFAKQKNKNVLIPVLIILVGFIGGFKIYWAIFIFLGLGLVTSNEFFKLVKKKTNTFKYFFILSFFSFFLFLMIYLSNNTLGNNGLIWTPLIWPKILLNANHLNYNDWWLKGQVFLADNNFKRIFLQNVEAIIIALFSIYGTRLLPFVFLPFIKSLRIEFNFLFFYIPMLIFTFLGLNTTQFPGSFNTFNFFIVNCFVLIYFLPAVIFWFKNKIKIKFLFNTLLIIIVALTVPRALYQTYRFCKMILEDKKSLLITNEQIELFTYLKKNKDNWLIQPYPNNITASSNSFLPFFSQRASYLTGQQTLDSQGFNWQNRSQELENIFNLSDYRLRSELFKKLSIYYFYIQNDDEIKWLDLENTTNNWYDIIASNNAGYLIKLK